MNDNDTKNPLKYELLLGESAAVGLDNAFYSDDKQAGYSASIGFYYSMIYGREIPQFDPRLPPEVVAELRAKGVHPDQVFVGTLEEVENELEAELRYGGGNMPRATGVQ